MSKVMQNARNKHDMQDYFYSLADKLFSMLQGEERLLLGFGGEVSDFVRLNHNRIRQAGHAAHGCPDPGMEISPANCGAA